MPRAPECTPRGGNFKYATHVAYQEQLQRETFAFGGLTEAACICRRVGPSIVLPTVCSYKVDDFLIVAPLVGVVQTFLQVKVG